MKQTTIDNALESLRHLDGTMEDRMNDHRRQVFDAWFPMRDELEKEKKK